MIYGKCSDIITCIVKNDKAKGVIDLKLQSHTFNIAVCDDEPQALEIIAGMTKQICDKESIKPYLSCFENGRELLDAINGGKSYDVLLLDVMMPQQDGMELAEFLRKDSFDGSIVFISSNKEMALRGYEVSAARYLAKPVEEKRLREALLYCFGQVQTNKELLIPVNGGTQRFRTEEIMYIETQGRGCRVVQEQDECVTPMRISEFESKISDLGFIRCHQGFLVNMRFICVVRAAQVELMNGICIPVSKHRIQEVRKQFFSWMEK